MFSRYKISGNSMLPALKDGQQVIAEKFSYLFLNPKINDIIIFKSPDNLNLIKRIIKQEGNNYFVEGDNKKESINSRNFGPIQKNKILAKII